MRQDFGITPKGILATTAEDVLDKNGAVKPHLIKRGNQFNTRIAALRDVDCLETYFKENIIV